MLNDIISEIKHRASLVEIITALKVGEFPTLREDGKCRGAHKVCGSTSLDSCVVDGRNKRWKCFRCGAGGDTIGWVLSAKFAGDRSRYRDAVEWLAAYYSVTMGLDTPINLPQYQSYVLLTDLAHRWNKALLADEDKLNWVRNKWYLTRETVEELLIGYCDGLSGVTDVDNTTLMAAGLLDSRATQPLDNRIVFPFLRAGQVVWMAGRSMVDLDGVPKYASLQRTSCVTPTLYNYDNAYNEPVTSPIFFTEGLGDAARAYQEGLRVVAPGGANAFTHEMHQDTAHLLKVCRDARYIVFDTDDNRAGQIGARSFAQSLITFGCDPYIVDLPPRDGHRQTDFCDFVEAYGMDGLSDLLRSEDKPPRTLPEALIDECPATAEPDRILSVLGSIAPLSDLQIGKYLDALARKTRNKLGDLKKELTKAKKRSERMERRIADEYVELPFLGQDFVYHKDADVWRAHTTLYIPYVEKVTADGAETEHSALHPVHLAVDMGAKGVFTVLRPEVLADPSKSVRERLPSRIVANERSNRWSISSRFPFSFNNFTDGAVSAVDAGDLYQRIYKLFDGYVWLPDARDKHILVLYVMLTYIFMGFPAIPYLHFKGKKNSGKSTAMDIMALLAFNTAPASTMTEAVLFRIAHASRPTVIIDEAEKLKNPPAGCMDFALLQLCLGSYANNAQAQSLRCGKDDLEPEAFKTYSPKIFGSIAELKDTLRSRSIVIDSASPDIGILRTLGDWDSDKVYLEADMQDIRDRLRVWALTQFRTVRETYDAISRDRAEFLMTRDRQIWKPLLAIADVVSQSWGMDISASLLENAQDKVKKAQASETSEFANIILITLYKCWKDNADNAGYYHQKRKDQHCICPAMAVMAIKNRMMENQIWQEKFTRLDSTYLVGQLRMVSAVPQAAKFSTGNVSGTKRDIVAFDIERLDTYLKAKGLLNDDSEYGDTEQDQGDTDGGGLGGGEDALQDP